MADFGKQGDHLVFCRAIAASSSNANADILEYVRRDILNAALRNTDNHGRNTALLKAHGQATLSPLYDFAPMFLDPDGIPRASRWPGNLEPNIGRPDWGNIGEALADFCKAFDLHDVFAAESETVRRLPDIMKQYSVEDEVITVWRTAAKRWRMTCSKQAGGRLCHVRKEPTPTFGQRKTPFTATWSAGR